MIVRVRKGEAADDLKFNTGTITGWDGCRTQELSNSVLSPPQIEKGKTKKQRTIGQYSLDISNSACLLA